MLNNRHTPFAPQFECDPACKAAPAAARLRIIQGTKRPGGRLPAPTLNPTGLRLVDATYTEAVQPAWYTPPPAPKAAAVKRYTNVATHAMWMASFLGFAGFLVWIAK